MNLKNNNKKLLLTIIGVLIFVAAVAGVTYAFFAVSVTSGDVIQGSTAVNGEALRLEVAQVSQGTGLLIPQLDNAIQGAVTGATGKGTCIDDNGNTICKVYSIKITNLTNATVSVEGTLKLTANKMDNLKWTKGTSATTGFPTPANTYYTKANTALADTQLTTAGTTGDNKTFYVVIWISEISNSQTDQGDFKGVVTFNAYTTDANGNKIEGVTSTFNG